MDGSNRGRCDDSALMVCDRDPLLPGLRRVSRPSNSIALFVAMVLVPSPWSTPISRCFAAARWATRAMHALPQRPISGPFREDCVDGRVMDGWVATSLCRHGQALPWPPRREAPHAEVPDARRAPCARETSPGHRQARDDTALALGGGALGRHRRHCRRWGCDPPSARASHRACGRVRAHQCASEMTRGADV
jgi:hypothetical protein